MDSTESQSDENILPASSTPGKASRTRGSGYLGVAVVGLAAILLLGIGVVGGLIYQPDADAAFRDKTINLKMGLTTATEIPLSLGDRYTDADGDLIADAPADPKDWIDPDVLIFSTLGEINAEQEAANWSDFIAFLRTVTGKEVKLVQKSFLRKEQFEEIASGDVHILALSTGNVMAGVNLAGFVPVCVMGDAQGKWGYQMEIITPKDRPINSIYEMGGKKVAFANFQSHSGFKLPFIRLWEIGLEFDRDYRWTYTGGQIASIQAVRNGQCDAAGVANDLLRREIAAGRLRPDDYKTIFTSATFPPACFGYVHNLKPELAAQIRSAFLEFNWSGTSLERAYQAANQVKFVPVSFKRDWAIVRDIDEQLRRIKNAPRGQGNSNGILDGNPAGPAATGKE